MNLDQFKQWLQEKWIASSITITKAQFAALVFLVFLIVLGSSILYFKGRNPTQVMEVKSASEANTQKKSKPKTILVHVAGAVRNPDVYELEVGKRVIDALKMAGGLTEDANPDALNLASKLKDAQKIYVPRKGEAPLLNGGGISPEGETKIDLNTASAQQLEELPGVGPTLAQRIIDYRTEHNGFNNVQELQEVEGIGPKKYSQIKDKVIVN